MFCCIESEDLRILCCHPSPWDAVGMKHICSKSSLHTGFELIPGITIFAYRNRQNQANRAENAKPSQFSRVFLEVPGSLRRNNEILQALILQLHPKSSGVFWSQGFFFFVVIRQDSHFSFQHSHFRSK